MLNAEFDKKTPHFCGLQMFLFSSTVKHPFQSEESGIVDFIGLESDIFAQIRQLSNYVTSE
jgi:hypothetical protein